MKILIDISEDDYKEVLKDVYSGTPFENRVFSAIQNGTVLPEKHGRLILEFLDFLYNHINPNDMEMYRAMFESKANGDIPTET